MRVTIISANECMNCLYNDICSSCGCKAKVYTKMCNGMNAQIGNPDLIILFTNSVSRKMVRFALSEAKRYNTPVACCHGSSASALRGTLNDHLPEAVNF